MTELVAHVECTAWGTRPHPVRGAGRAARSCALARPPVLEVRFAREGRAQAGVDAGGEPACRRAWRQIARSVLAARIPRHTPDNVPRALVAALQPRVLQRRSPLMQTASFRRCRMWRCLAVGLPAALPHRGGHLAACGGAAGGVGGDGSGAAGALRGGRATGAARQGRRRAARGGADRRRQAFGASAGGGGGADADAGCSITVLLCGRAVECA